jgi:large subunit ribosomal protein L22
MKRVRPAPMGRAFRVVKRTAHLTVQVAERPLEIEPVAVAPAAAGEDKPAPQPRKAKPAAKKAARPRARKAGVRKKAPARSARTKKG